MRKKKLWLVPLVIVGVVVLTWLGLLYTTYGRQTLLFLLQSSPEIMWSYSKALLPAASPAQPVGGSNELSLDRLERPAASLAPIASKHMITTMSHTYQKLNNCGPSTASMAASSLGITFDQFFAADQLKGGPGDKNVGPLELVKFLDSQGLRVAYRLNGNAEIIEQLVSRDIPVIVEQWLVKRGSGELVGHYRVVRGYDQQAKLFTTNDSFNGPNFVIPYPQFDEWWRPFNRTYLVVYKPDQERVVKDILREDWDRQLNLQGATQLAQAETSSFGDGYSYFNLGTAQTMLHQYSEGAKAYDRALQTTFPEHFLWYQFGPLEAYFQTGQYERVLQLSDELLHQAGQVEEAHYYRELMYLKQGKMSEAAAAAQAKLAANPRFVAPFE